MNFLTDRKRATGLGSGHTGAQHHWLTIATSLSLVILVPLFIFTFGYAVGHSFEDVLAFYGNPFVAIITALCLVGGIIHLKTEVDEAVEELLKLNVILLLISLYLIGQVSFRVVTIQFVIN